MRRIILVELLAFIALSSFALANGFRLGADALFGGQTKISISGTGSATGNAANEDFEADNALGFMVGGSYYYDFSDKFFALLGVTYTSQETEEVMNMAKASGTSWVAGDNGTVKTSSVDIQIGGQAKADDFSLGLVVTFPVWAQVRGAIDNTTGKDDYDLAGGLGLDFNIDYSFTENFSTNIGYSFLNTSDSGDKGDNNRELSVASSVDRWKFGVYYTF